MGLLDFLLEAADVLSELSSEGGKRYTAKCETFELFEIGTSWRGTARVHGAGNHLQTINQNVSKSLTLPNEGDIHYTPRGLLRRDFRKWAGECFSANGSISKDFVKLNDGENCLSVEGYVKKVGDQWKIVTNTSEATNFGSYKISIFDRDNDIVGHEELSYLFMEDTIGRVTSVDVTDGF